MLNRSEKQTRGQKGELAPKQCKGKHAYKVIVIGMVFELLDKGHEADNLQKGCSYFIVIKIVLKGGKTEAEKYFNKRKRKGPKGPRGPRVIHFLENGRGPRGHCHSSEYNEQLC